MQSISAIVCGVFAVRGRVFWIAIAAVLVCGYCSSAVSAAPLSADESGSFGSLKLCPAGGRHFMMAWGMACEMKKRRKREVQDASEYRPATLMEIMKICCHLGCEIRDLLPYCDPFGSWNS